MIQLRIKKESDLYNPLDPSQTKIRGKVYRYLKSFCTEREYQKHMNDTLQIITDSPIDKDRFQTVLQDAVKGDLTEFDWQISRNNRRVIWEYIVGIGLSLLGIGLSIYMDQVLMAIISFLGTTAISNAIAIQTTVNHDLKKLKKRLDPFGTIKIEVIMAGEENANSERNEMGEMK